MVGRPGNTDAPFKLTPLLTLLIRFLSDSPFLIDRQDILRIMFSLTQF